ncbi:Fic family protein [Candidatus Shapirobacteria bacterium]|nr:Fic family protein [Candidatus Shapirobacteria bacterium]
MFSYHFNSTLDINKHLIDIEAIKISFENSKILPQLEEKILRQSILRSSVFSARIEGNPLSLQNYDRYNDEHIHKIEINNLLKTYQKLNNSDTVPILTIKKIKSLHEEVMNNLSPMTGKFRQEPWAIFDQSGNVIHLAPTFLKLPELMEEYLTYIDSIQDHPVIKSAIAQFVFEKIHPFADGNGRTGRLISMLILKQANYHFRGMLPFEEYTDTHRQAYYYALEPSTDITEFIEYFLKSLVVTGKQLLTKIKNTLDSLPQLSPRRQEILSIITDHPNCSFNFLQRRFSQVNSKTLHYDLLQLMKKGLVIKLGTTRAVVYTISK